jgi:starvation-inducible DNA-binding protein
MQQMTAPTIGGLPGVEPDLRDHLIASLNHDLASLTDLIAAYKQAHWNVLGMDFAQLHELFDTLAAQTRDYVDLVAERAVTLGGAADGTIQAAVEHTSLPPFPRAERDERLLLQELVGRTEQLGAELRRSMDEASDEPATEDVCIEVTRGIEKQRWMLLAHLAGVGGNDRTRG